MCPEPSAMPKVQFLLLVKVFEEKEHADDFQDGLLYARRLKHFRNEEDEKRRDEHEGTVLFDEEWKFSVQDDDGEYLPLNFVGPVLRHHPVLDALNIFCMTCFQSSFDHGLMPALLDEVLDQIDDSLPTLAAWGKHAVLITKPEEFWERLAKAISDKGYRYSRNLVEYYDKYPFNATTIERALWRHAFLKSSRFEKEREYRFAIHRNTPGDDPLELQVGSLRDISVYQDTHRLADRSRWRVVPATG